MYTVSDFRCSFIYAGLSKDAAKYIVEAGNVFGVGLDTPSLDPGKIVSFEAHQTLLGAQIFGIENLNLENDALPGNLCTLIESENSTLLIPQTNLTLLLDFGESARIATLCLRFLTC